MSKTPYEVLGVAPTTPQDEIRDAYRKLAKKTHPDLNPGNKDAEKKFKEISAAYELVGTPENRAKYEQGKNDEAQAASPARRGPGRRGPFYHQTQQDGGRYSFSSGGTQGEMGDDLFQSIFGSGASGDFRGQDTLYQLDIGFRDAVLGAEREITLPSGKRLRVKIPAGVDSGAKLRFSGQGEPGSGTAEPGDAYVQLNVHGSAIFKRSGGDLEVELPVSISEAVLGSEVKVPTIDGSVLLKIPSGVSTGNRLRISGKGVLNGTSGKRGDQYVVVKIVLPPAAAIDAEFKQAVEAWSKRQSFDPRSSWIGAQGGV